MSQREYEDLPEAPDLGQNIQEDSAETLVGPPNSEPLDAGYVPPDRPYGLDDDQVGTRLSDEPENMDTRLRRERPDVGPDDPLGSDTAEPDRAARLEPSSPGVDGSYDESMEAVDAGLSGGAATAEEAAMHERGEGEVGGTDPLSGG